MILRTQEEDDLWKQAVIAVLKREDPNDHDVYTAKNDADDLIEAFRARHA